MEKDIKVVALWAYSKNEENELDFEAGDLILILDIDEGWSVSISLLCD